MTFRKLRKRRSSGPVTSFITVMQLTRVLTRVNWGQCAPPDPGHPDLFSSIHGVSASVLNPGRRAACRLGIWVYAPCDVRRPSWMYPLEVGLRGSLHRPVRSGNSPGTVPLRPPSLGSNIVHIASLCLAVLPGNLVAWSESCWTMEDMCVRMAPNGLPNPSSTYLLCLNFHIQKYLPRVFLPVWIQHDVLVENDSATGILRVPNYILSFDHPKTHQLAVAGAS